MRPRCGEGNFNAALNRCTCPIGRNGTRCEQDALPACRTSASAAAASCLVGRPMHCACAEECIANGAFSHQIHRYCFVTLMEKDLWGSLIKASREHSEIPAEDERAEYYDRTRIPSELTAQQAAGVAARVTYQEVTREVALTVWRTDHANLADGRLRHVPLALCGPLRCSERGACVAATNASAVESSKPRCQCDSYYSGKHCERHASLWCWNECSGRGQCIDGFCKCGAPYYGPGCAYGGGAGDENNGGRLHQVTSAAEAARSRPTTT